MGYRDFPCVIDNAETDRMHDAAWNSAPDVSRQDAAAEITNVFCGTQSHAFGLDREHLVETFRSMFVDADDRRIEYLMLSLLHPERYAYLAEMQSDWVRGYARAVANGEVRA